MIYVPPQRHLAVARAVLEEDPGESFWRVVRDETIVARCRELGVTMSLRNLHRVWLEWDREGIADVQRASWGTGVRAVGVIDTHPLWAHARIEVD